MQASEQYKSDFVERMFFVNVLLQVMQIFSIYESENLQRLEQYIFRCFPRRYFRLNSTLQTLHLSMVPLKKGILCH